MQSVVDSMHETRRRAGDHGGLRRSFAPGGRGCVIGDRSAIDIHAARLRSGASAQVSPGLGNFMGGGAVLPLDADHLAAKALPPVERQLPARFRGECTFAREQKSNRQAE